MKKSIQIMLLLALFSNAQAQTWEEWTQQKKLAIQRLREQIAANQVYLDYAKKGYRLVSHGLQSVEIIKQGDYALHLGYFDSLRKVNPRIKGCGKVAEIIKMQMQLLETREKAITVIRESARFNADEQVYGRQVIARVTEASAECLDELTRVIGNSMIPLTDDARIRRIDQLYLDVQDQLSFMQSFSNEVALLALQRLTEQTEIEYSKKLR